MKITSVKASTDGFYVVVSAGKLFNYTLRRSYESETHRKLAVIGASFEAAQLQADADIAAGKVANPGKLAKGLDVHNAPHSTKAMADSKGKPAPKAAKPAKVAKPKVAKGNATPKADDPRSIVHLRKDYVFGAEGTARRASWDTCVKSKTVAAYLASGGKAKYLPRWVSAGVIKLEGK
jgi:hypothetical protein